MIDIQIFKKINTKVFKQINTQIYIMGFVGFLMNFAATLIYTTLLIFVGGNNNIFTQTNIIIIRNLSEALANFSKILSGFLSDRLQNRKSFLLVGYSAMLITKVGFLILTFKDYFPLVFLQILFIINQIFDRCMNAIRDPARDAILMEYSTPDTRGICFGIRKFITSLGSIISGILTGFLIFLWRKQYTNTILYTYILLPILLFLIAVISFFVQSNILFFMLSSILILFIFVVSYMSFPSLLYTISVVPIILTLVLIVKKIKDVKSNKIINSHNIININLLKIHFHKIKKLIILLLIMCFLSLGKLNDFCLFSRGMDLGMSNYLVPFMFTIMYIAITIFSYLFGLLIDKKKNFLTLFISITSILIANYFLSIYNNHFIFWISLILNSAFLAALDSSFASIITFYIPFEEIKATIFGLMYGISGFMALFNTCLVAFFKTYGYTLQMMYGISCIPLLIGFLILIINYRSFQNEII